MYCGNNYYKLDVQRLGTPYECMKKGIGAGLYGDLDGFEENYRAIFPNDKYCGTSRVLPTGMIRGHPHECLSKGYGVGMKMQSRRGYRFTNEVDNPRVLLFVVVVAMVVIVFVFGIKVLLILGLICAGVSLVVFLGLKETG